MPTKTINDLTATADILDADELAFWNVANARTDKITYVELKTDLFGGLSGDTEILFNNSGNIDGDSRLTYTQSTNVLAFTGTFGAATMQLKLTTAPAPASPVDSPDFLLTSQFDDGADKDTDWKHFVNATNDAGASLYAIQNRIDGGAYITHISFSDAEMALFGAGGLAMTIDSLGPKLQKNLNCNGKAITAVSTVTSSTAGGYRLIGGAGSATLANIIPNRNDQLSGLGGAAGSPAMITSSISRMTWTDTLITSVEDFKITDGKLLELGSKADPDPTGTAGDIYYNTTSNTFRGFTTGWGLLGGTPGGSDTEMQYNNGGVFGGTSVLMFNDTTNLLSYVPLLDEATGDEIGLNINMTVNKATSGNYAAIQVNVTETSAPGSANRVLRLRVANSDVFTVSDTGVLALDGNIVSIGTAISIGNSGTLTRMAVSNNSTGDPYYQLAISTTRAYALGIDNTDGDTLKITTDSAGSVNPSTGTTIMTFAAGPNIGFFGVAAVAQPTHIVDADGTLADITTKFNTLLAQMATLGLQAAS